MKHTFFVLIFILFLQSQSFHFSVGGQFNALLTQTEGDNNFGPSQSNQEKLSLSHMMKNAIGFSISVKLLLNERISIGLKHFRSGHDIEIGKFIKAAPSDARFLLTSLVPIIGYGNVLDNGSYISGYLGLNIEKYEFIFKNSEDPEFLEGASNILLGFSADLPLGENSPLGISLDLSFQLGSTKLGNIFDNTEISSEKVHSNILRIGASIYYSFGSIRNL